MINNPTLDKEVKTVYCLYRVSTKGQVDKNDIPMQKQACREFAARQRGWVIKKEFQEQGVSGFKISANDRDAVPIKWLSTSMNAKSSRITVQSSNPTLSKESSQMKSIADFM